MPFSFFVKYMRINFVMLRASSLYQITNIFWPAKKVMIYRKFQFKGLLLSLKFLLNAFLLGFSFISLICMPLQTCAKPTSKNHEIILVKVRRFKTPGLFCFMPPIHIYSICDITFRSTLLKLEDPLEKKIYQSSPLSSCMLCTDSSSSSYHQVKTPLLYWGLLQCHTYHQNIIYILLDSVPRTMHSHDAFLSWHIQSPVVTLTFVTTLYRNTVSATYLNSLNHIYENE